MVIDDCSFGLMRLFCGIIGNFNRLSAEDKKAGVGLPAQRSVARSARLEGVTGNTSPVN